MKTTSTKLKIIHFMMKHEGWAWGGTIEDHIRLVSGNKGGTTSRELRDLTHNGVRVDDKYFMLDKRLEKVGEKGPRAVQYRLVRMEATRVDQVLEQQEKQSKLF